MNGALGPVRPPRFSHRLGLFSTLFLLLLRTLTVSAATEKVLASESHGSGRGWALGELVPVECLNRTIETGEHITDEAGELQYIPFWKCNETGRALEVAFGSEKDVNCTIAEVDDPFFHILEFYVHNDAPLSCRIPSLPPAGRGSTLTQADYTHLQFALTDPSKASAGPSKEDKEKKRGGKQIKDKKKGALEGEILAATAYSLPPTSSSPKIVIGDPLPLSLSIRWYSTSVLPPSTSKLGSGLGGHVHLSTAAYCLLSFGAGLAVSLAYFRGVEMPQRLRRYGAEKLGGGGEGRGGAGAGAGAGGGYGYAYVPGSFPNYSANGKRD